MEDGKSCTDSQPDCTPWAQQGECDNNPSFMSLSCRKACGLCGEKWLMPPRAKLQRLWLAMRFFLFGVGATFAAPQALLAGLKAQCARRGNFGNGCVLSDDYDGLVPLWGWKSMVTADYSTLITGLALFVPAGVVFLVCALVVTRANRGRFLRCLGSHLRVDVLEGNLLGGESHGNSCVHKNT